MSSRIVVAVLLAFITFAVYSWWSTRNHDGFHGLVSLENEEPSQGLVAPAGPAAPAQAPPREAPAVIMPEETPFDPQAEVHEDASMPDRLRHPDRAFGPGLVNEDTEAAVAAGTASYASEKTGEAYQTFGPEFAQNGGMFMENGVSANDVSVDQSYSSV
jgi:hypothetical protein